MRVCLVTILACDAVRASRYHHSVACRRVRCLPTLTAMVYVRWPFVFCRDVDVPWRDGLALLCKTSGVGDFAGSSAISNLSTVPRSRAASRRTPPTRAPPTRVALSLRSCDDLALCLVPCTVTASSLLNNACRPLSVCVFQWQAVPVSHTACADGGFVPPPPPWRTRALPRAHLALRHNNTKRHTRDWPHPRRRRGAVG